MRHLQISSLVLLCLIFLFLFPSSFLTGLYQQVVGQGAQPRFFAFVAVVALSAGAVVFFISPSVNWIGQQVFAAIAVAVLAVSSLHELHYLGWRHGAPDTAIVLAAAVIAAAPMALSIFALGRWFVWLALWVFLLLYFLSASNKIC